MSLHDLSDVRRSRYRRARRRVSIAASALPVAFALLTAVVARISLAGDLPSTPMELRGVAPRAGARAPAPVRAEGGGAGPPASLVTIGLNFQGSELNVDSGFIPPDTMGAVGPDHIVELINGRFDVYNKATGVQVMTASLDFFWTNVVGVAIPNFNDVCTMGNCSVSGTMCTDNNDCLSNFTFDPRIVFDPDSGRWFAMALDSTNPATGDNNIYLARTDTDDPTGDWDGLRFDADTVGAAEFHDYETLAVDADGLYSCTQDFNAGGDESCYSIPKADLLLAAPSIANMTRFEATPANLPTVDGSIQAALDFGPSDGRAAILGTTGGALIRGNILGAGAAGATLGPTTAIAGDPGHAAPPPARQPHPAGRTIENVAPRIVANVFEEGDSLWAVHAVQGTMGNSAIRWYEIDEINSTVLQTGLLEAANQDFHEPSVAANARGDVVIGYTCSGPALAPSSCVSVGETNGGVTTFDPPLVLQLGAGHYWVDQLNPPNSERNRWGDYSATVIDPIDPCTFWTFEEFVAVSAVGDVGPNVCSNNAGITCMVDGDCGGGGATCNPLPEGGSWGIQITELTFNACAEADLAITKSDDPDPVVAGTTLEYEINVENLGPSRARDVVVTDTLPPGVEFDSALGFNWSCNHVAGIVTCTWQGGNPPGSLAEGEAANPITITVSVLPSTLGMITNTPMVSAQTLDPEPANNAAPTDTTVIAMADLAIMKDSAPDPAFEGLPLVFTIHVENLGPSDAQNAVFTEEIPSMTKFHSVVAPPGWNCVTPPVMGSGTVTCTTPTFPANTMVEFQVKVLVDLTGPGQTTNIVNVVVISSSTEDPVPENGSASLSTEAMKGTPTMSGVAIAVATLLLLVIARRAMGRGGEAT